MGERILTGTGRPTDADTKARTRRMLELVASGTPLNLAAAEARVKPARVLRLLSRDEFLAVYVAIRDGRAGPTAVLLDQAVDAAA